MTESIFIGQNGILATGDSVSQEIVNKPHLSGAQLYRRMDGHDFLVKLGKNWGGGLYRFHVGSMRFEPIVICNFESAHLQGNSSGREMGSRFLPDYHYLGRFSVVGGGRGNEMIYEPAAAASEEPPLINGECP